MSFIDRFRAGPDPQEPASPAPFDPGERVIVSTALPDPAFVRGQHGTVTATYWQPGSPIGPWAILVRMDHTNIPVMLPAAELTREAERFSIEVEEPNDVTDDGLWETVRDDLRAIQAEYQEATSKVGPDRERLPLTPHLCGLGGVFNPFSGSAQIEEDLREMTEKGDPILSEARFAVAQAHRKGQAS